MNKMLIFILIFRFLTIVPRHPTYVHFDQYNQVLEVAHHIVFGYGNLTWEWIMDNPIRSPLFPLFFSLPYKLLKMLELDNTDWIMIPPRLYQFTIACLFDIFLVKLNRIISGPKKDWQILLLSYTSYVSVSNFSATLINNTECVLTLIAFYLWQRRHEGRNDLISRLLVLFTFCMRGTSIMFWVLVWPYELLTMPGNLASRARFVVKNLLWVAAMVLASMGVAYLYYGKPHFVEYNFFYYNFYLDWSGKFGVDKWYVYIVDLIPLYLLHLLPLFLFGIWFTFRDGLKKMKQDEKQCQEQPNNRKHLQLIGIIGCIVFFLSLNSHKEDRFLTTLIPLIYILALKGWNQLGRVTTNSTLITIFKTVVVVVGVSSVLLRTYIYSDNQYAQAIAQLRRDPSLKSIEFFSLAHATPHYSELHRNVSFHYPLFTTLYQPFPEKAFTNNAKSYYAQRMEKFKTQGYPSHIFVQQRPHPSDNIVVDRTIYPDQLWDYKGAYYRVTGRGNPPAKLYRLNCNMQAKK